MTACPGVCNAGWRATGEGEPRDGEPFWCGACKASLRGKLADLDYQYAVRAFHADGHRGQPEEPSRGTGHAQSPSQAVDDVEEGTGWLWDWEDAARKEMGLPASYHAGHPSEIRSKVIAWLAERLDRVLECGFAVDFGREVNARHWELLGKNSARPPRRGLTPCPMCGLKLLTWIDGYQGLVCGNCNRHVTAEEYAHDISNLHARQLEQAG